MSCCFHVAKASPDEKLRDKPNDLHREIQPAADAWRVAAY